MDKTELYTKMCERATEIQGKNIKWDIGNFYFNQKDGEVAIYSCDNGEYLEFIELKSGKPYALDELIIWLPRQDQLQKMVDVKYAKDLFNIRDISEAEFEYIQSNEVTFEQFWLRYVMHEKYGKVWNGEDWVKE